MEEVRQLVQEEGREARNLVAFHVAVDTPARVSRKPPRGAPPPRRSAPRPAARLRSASAGRDKRSELRARYWALLFGDLQRSVGEIYNTVEANENQNECQEVILVLENYLRDFKALSEWFRLKWDYDNTPPPQRPQSLAWEIRKTDFVRPESRRAYSVKSSPSVSGKNSPCLSGHNTPSGKNSPNLTGKASPGSGKISPKVSGHVTSPKGNIEFFSNKMSTKITTRPEPKTAKDSRLSDIKEKEVKDVIEDNDVKDEVMTVTEDVKAPVKQPIVEIGKAKEIQNVTPKPVLIKSPKCVPSYDRRTSVDELSSQAKATIDKLNAMENEFLAKQLTENAAKNDNLLNKDKEKVDNNIVTESNDTDISVNLDKDESNPSESPEISKSEDNFGDISNESSKSDEKKPTEVIDAVDEANDEKKEASNAPDNTEKTKVPPDLTNDDFPPTLPVPNEDSNMTEETSENLAMEDKRTNAQFDKQPVPEIPTGDVKDDTKKEDAKKSETKAADVKLTRAAYSQAAAKPKTAVTPKIEVKTPTRSLSRSKTVVEMHPAPRSRAVPKRNPTSKCSYPFNLTTGRKSLFDAPAPKVVVKKPPVTPKPHLAAGDAKIVPKVDAKKRPSRPSTLKINEKGDKIEKVDPSFEISKDCDDYSSSDTIVTQIDITRIYSTESLKTLIPEDKYKPCTNSVEVLNWDDDNDKCDNDGWLTVKSRRLNRESKKSKSHWANRFHQPSATTSLPTLNMMESPKSETNPLHSKLDRAKSEQPGNLPGVMQVAEERHEEPEEKVLAPLSKDPAMIRQKSDVTGLKTRSLRTRALKREKKDRSKDDDGELTKNRLHSSLESLTTGLARSQESTEQAFDFDKWKAEFKSNFKYLDDDDQIPDHNEILKTADPSEMSEIAEMTSQIEENEKKLSWALDFQSEVDQRKLCEEEDLLNRQIMELQQVSDIDLDTETDDTETDAEIPCEDSAAGNTPSADSLASLTASLEDQYESALAGMSWAERVDTLVVLQALVTRDPGRAQQLHAKLSQGIKRRGSLQDALRRLQAKQARAEKQRLHYRTERATKIHVLLARVEEVKVAKNTLIEEKRIRMERRLQKAAENRDQHLKDIVRKAHDEEEKLREIAFIKQLEAENRRHEFLDQCRSHTTRLRQMRRERLTKLEQKAAREAAVGARRTALEEARRRKLESLVQRRSERGQRATHLKELKRQERGCAAREKAESVKSRLSALAAAASQEAAALRSRIRDKQDASQQRLESRLQAIREKATGPRPPTTSESHDQMTKEEKELAEEAERQEKEKRDKEKLKSMKKRSRKVKQKLVNTTIENKVFTDDYLSGKPDPFVGPPKVYRLLSMVYEYISPLLDENKIDTNLKSEENTHVNGLDEKNNEEKGNSEAKIKTNTDCNDNNTAADEINDNNNKAKPAKKGKDKRKTKAENNIKNGDCNGDANKNTDLHINKIKSNNDDTEKNINATTDAKEEVVVNNKKNEEENEKTSKKKKKRNRENAEAKKEKAKLSKANSVCSLVSDLSKASVKSDKKAQLSVDPVFLDKILKEILRSLDKIDFSSKSLADGLRQAEKKIMYKMLILRMAENVLEIAVEQESLTSLLKKKSLFTVALILSRVICVCAASAAYFVGGNSPIYIVKLLSNAEDTDLNSDRGENVELTKLLIDCLSIGLDSVLCATRLQAEGTGDGNTELVTSLRMRAHGIISYLCLSGCVSRIEQATEVGDSMQALLTVCAELCQPSELDSGTERASATQSLRSAITIGFGSSRNLICAVFSGSGCEHTKFGGFVRAARSARLLRVLAELDYTMVQEAFIEGSWPLEFRSAVGYMLSQHAPNEKEAPRNKTLHCDTDTLNQSLAQSMVMDLIMLSGFLVVNNPKMQEVICRGWGAIRVMCNLPAHWLVSKTRSHALLPALVALSEWPPAGAMIASEMSMQMLEEFIHSDEAKNNKLALAILQGRAKKKQAAHKK